MLNPASEAFETALHAALPAAAFRPLEPRYLEEPRGRYKAEDALLVAPGTVDEVARLIGLANEMGVGVIPYGGGTGLVGGQTMEHGPKPVLLSMERMSAIRATYASEGVMVAEAGAILSNVHDAAEDAGRIFPLTLASQGSARIGGLLATNAGGIGVLRRSRGVLWPVMVFIACMRSSGVAMLFSIMILATPSQSSLRRFTNVRN